MVVGKLETDIEKPAKKMGNRTEQIARIKVVDLVCKDLVGKIILRVLPLRVVARHLLSCQILWEKYWT